MACIRGILLDKDGTLIDFERTWGPAVQAVLQGLAGGNDTLYRQLAEASGFDDVATRFRPDSLLIGEPTSVFAAPWAKLLGRAADASFFSEVDRLLGEAATRHLAAIGDPETVLKNLVERGYRLGLFTNDAEATARAHARKLGLESILSFIAGYDSGFGAKPDAGPVLAFAASLGLSASNILVVGDTAIDLAAAHAAGARAVIVRSGPAAPKLRDGDDVVIGSIADLAAWLDGLPRSAREH